jgi:hypothetical protein
MTEIPEMVSFLAQFLWAPFLWYWMEKQKTTRECETEEKKVLQDEVQKLKIHLAVLEKTSITDTYLRDYMEEKLGKMEEKLEGKIDGVNRTLAEILRSLPKRKAEQE